MTKPRATGTPSTARCGVCGWTLAETLAGDVYCPHKLCTRYKEKVGRAAVVAGALES